MMGRQSPYQYKFFVAGFSLEKSVRQDHFVRGISEKVDPQHEVIPATMVTRGSTDEGAVLKEVIGAPDHQPIRPHPWPPSPLPPLFLLYPQLRWLVGKAAGLPKWSSRNRST